MKPEIKLAYYAKKDWDKLMNSIVDRDSMHDTWEEWHKEYRKSRKRLKKLGFVVHDMPIDIDDLNKYCTKRGLKNDGNTRSQYTSRLPLNKK